MRLKVNILRNRKWLTIALLAILVPALPVYAFVQQSISQRNNSATTRPIAVDSSEYNTNSSKNTNEAHDDAVDGGADEASASVPQENSANTEQDSISSQASGSATQPSPVTQPKEKVKPTPEPTSYTEGGSPWWVNKRWTDFGYLTGYWGNTCSSWMTGAQASGVAVVSGPDLHRILCQDTSGYSLFGFIEQVRPDGYVISAYNWAGESGEKQLIMKSFNGYSFLAPKSK